MPETPNVLLIVLDDLGFAQLGCFGSDVATPTIDGLASGGLRYNQFHVTSLCAPTRAALLTGRNHHSVGMGDLLLETRFPGYTGRIPRSAATLARHLRGSGYATMAIGKWHLVPRTEHSPAGPFDHWPLGLGFERYYGFLGGMTSHWSPDLARDNAVVDPPYAPADGYHLTEDLTDQAIAMLHDHQQGTAHRPFFMYFATGAVHQPHHVAAEWSDRYRGQFNGGWDMWRKNAFVRQQELGVVPEGTVLTERPSWVAEWESLGDGERTLYSRMMEVFAGFLTHTDAQIGRLLEWLSNHELLANTLVMVLSDNGASADGGPHGWLNQPHLNRSEPDNLSELIAHQQLLGGHRAYNHYAWGWAWAGNSPFKLWKRYAWLGGVRSPLIVHWPAGLADEVRGQVRPDFCHAIDIMPTVLELAGVQPAPEVDGISQQPIDGRSLAATLQRSLAGSQLRTQYFEMHGSRAIYHNGWKATTNHIDDGVSTERAALQGSLRFSDDQWSLFRLGDDFSEAHDLAADQPATLARLIRLWSEEAERHQVLPLMSARERAAATIKPVSGRRRSVWLPGDGALTAAQLTRGFQLVATIDLAQEETASGVIAAQGDWNGGWACYLGAGRAVAVLTFGDAVYVAGPSAPIAPGAHTIHLGYRPTGTGADSFQLALDSQAVAEAAVPSLRWNWLAGLWLPLNGPRVHVGSDLGFPVTDDYTPPHPVGECLRKVIFETPATDHDQLVGEQADQAMDGD